MRVKPEPRASLPIRTGLFCLLSTERKDQTTCPIVKRGSDAAQWLVMCWAPCPSTLSPLLRRRAEEMYQISSTLFHSYVILRCAPVIGAPALPYYWLRDVAQHRPAALRGSRQILKPQLYSTHHHLYMMADNSKRALIPRHRPEQVVTRKMPTASCPLQRFTFRL